MEPYYVLGISDRLFLGVNDRITYHIQSAQAFTESHGLIQRIKERAQVNFTDEIKVYRVEINVEPVVRLEQSDIRNIIQSYCNNAKTSTTLVNFNGHFTFFACSACGCIND